MKTVLGRLGFLLFLGLSLAIPALASDAIVLAPTQARIDLADATYLLTDPEGQLELANIRSEPIASQFVQRTPKGRYSKAVEWMRFTVRNPADRPMTWWLDTKNHLVSELTVYTPDSRGVYQGQSVSMHRPFQERPVPTVDFVFPFEIPAQATVTIYLRARVTSFLNLDIRPAVWQPAAYQARAESNKIHWFLYLGMALALATINLALWLYLRDADYLRYVGSIFGFFIAISCGYGGNGMGFAFFWPHLPLLELVIASVSAFASIFFSCLFVNRLLNLPVVTPRLNRWMWRCISLLALTAAFRLVLALADIRGAAGWGQAAAQVAALVAMAIPLTIYPGIMVATYRRVPLARFVLLAYATLVITGVLNLGRVYLFDLGDTNWFIWSVCLEMSIMAIALAYRFHEERNARVAVLERSEQELEIKVKQRTDELTASEARTKDLLHNILPASIAAELATSGKAEPVELRSATMLFTDFAGFTQAASTMPAERMVAELNDIFSGFDDICRAYGVEKIKTIGDAYMAASGVPIPCADHAERAVTAGLAMCAFVEERNRSTAFKWMLRVGIHSGPVVAGVVGKHKYAFDVWGDTVNIASRMESAGEAGRVNVSAYTYDLVRSRYDGEYRGKISAKGKGDVDMYFVIRARDT